MAKYPRNVIITTLGSLLTNVSSEMIVYLLPLFLAGVLRTSITFVGLIEGVAETTASFTKLFSGYFSDRLGKSIRTAPGNPLSLELNPQRD